MLSTSIIVGFVWAILAAITAMLPMRLQMWPGCALLITAPALIVLIGMDYGLWVALICLAAFLSMMRNPLRYFWKRARGEAVELPPEMQRKPMR